MILKRLELRNFRNFENEVIELKDGVTIFYGLNGSGKTNIIEAITVLSGIKSFRGAKDRDLVKWNCDHYYCSGIFDDCKLEAGFGTGGKGREKRLKIDGSDAKSIVDYFGKAITVTFSPDDLSLIDGGPEIRRRFFDTILSKSDPQYFKDLILYKRILKFRNSILRTGKEVSRVKKELSVWDDSFASAGFSLHSKRNAFVEKFNGDFSETVASIAGEKGITVEYFPDDNYENIENYKEKYLSVFDKDLRYGYTTCGPHRDDFILKGFGGKSFASFASQGQKRSAAVALKISEKNITETLRGDKAILLVDDIFSEFDEERKKNLLELIQKNNQAIFTMADGGNRRFFSNASVFTIYEGKITGEI